MSPSRDPRRDPRPGDVVETYYFRRVVIASSGELVRYRESQSCSDVCHETTWRFITEWRDWARNAYVLHAAPEADR